MSSWMAGTQVLELSCTAIKECRVAGSWIRSRGPGTPSWCCGIYRMWSSWSYSTCAVPHTCPSSTSHSEEPSPFHCAACQYAGWCPSFFVRRWRRIRAVPRVDIASYPCEGVRVWLGWSQDWEDGSRPRPPLHCCVVPGESVCPWAASQVLCTYLSG